MTNPTDSPFIFESLPDGGVKITGVNDSNITEAVIPTGVKVIGEKAFAFCKELKRVVLPEGLTEIHKFAFSNCHKLTEVTIPSTVTSLDNTAFLGCFDLACIKVEPHNRVYRDIDGVLYSSDGLTLISYPVGRKQRSFCIPDEVAIIGSQCFSRNEYLEELTLPDTLMLIEYYAVDHLPALTRVNFNGSISDWSRMEIRDGNDKLLNARLHFTCLAPFEYCKAENGGYEITGVKDESLAEIVIPEGITGISDNAFGEHEGLRSIVIPEGVIRIGNSAFRECDGLTQIVIPASVLSIGDGAFYRCPSLTSITVHPGNANYKDIGGSLYTKDGTTLLQYAIGKSDTDFTLPEGVREITADAFYDCHAITRIVITEGCLNIGDRAFSWCEGLTDLTIPNSVKKIGDGAFSSCTSITVFTVPDGVTRIGRRTFEECEGLASIRLPLSITEIGEDAFAYCESLGEVIYEGDREQWAKIAVANGNQSLTKARITYLGEPLSKDDDTGDFDIVKALSPFNYSYWIGGGYEIKGPKDRSVTEALIPHGVTHIGKRAFQNCGNLTKVSLPGSVTSTGPWAFVGCSYIEEVHITDLEAWCRLRFWSDTDSPLGYKSKLYLNGDPITDLVIPDGITTVKSYAFAKGSCFSSITIPPGVTRIESNAFKGCSGISSITIPEGITAIEVSTFSYCSNLERVVIPESVTKIQYCAFMGCQKLAEVYYRGTKKQWKKIKIDKAGKGNKYLLKAKIHFEHKGD